MPTAQKLEDVHVTTSSQRRIKLLDWLYNVDVDSNAGTIELIKFTGADLSETDQELWRGTARSLKQDDLILLGDGYGFEGWCVAITDAGRDAIERWRAHRDSPAARRETAQANILRWLADQADDSGWHRLHDIAGTDLGHHEGVQLTQSQIARAAEQLQHDGLIEGDDGVAELPGPFTVRLTRAGLNCVESGDTVSDYLQKQQRPGTTNITNFNAPVSGNVNWASQHVSQNATTNTGIVGDELRLLVQAIVQALPALDLTDEQAAAVTRDAHVIEAELQHHTPESQSIVKSMMKRTFDTIQAETSNQLAAYLVTTGKHVLKNVGIDLG